MTHTIYSNTNKIVTTNRKAFESQLGIAVKSEERLVYELSSLDSTINILSESKFELESLLIYDRKFIIYLTLKFI